MGSIKEQVYQEKLNQLKHQLQMLNAGTHVDYVRQLEKLRLDQVGAIEFNRLCRQLEVERIERDCDNEKTAALREFEEKRTELRESLITELEEKRRQVEHEYQTMELTSDSVEAKPMKTRNLRRRYNDPAPVNDAKRSRKASPTLNLTLSPTDIADDLKLICASLPPLGPNETTTTSSAGAPANARASPALTRRERTSPEESATISTNDGDGSEVAIEDGKLIYQRKCYTRGQAVFVETSDCARAPAVVQTIGTRDLSLRLTNGKRLHITVAQLQQGKCVLWRRPN